MRKYVKAEIIELVNQEKTLEQIGNKYGVTRQRMYQIFSALGIDTLVKKKKSELRDKTEKEQWLWAAVVRKLQGRPRVEKQALFDSLVVHDTCPVLGIPINYNTTKGKPGPDSPSFDQIIPRGGYIPGNVEVISWRANRLKSDSTPEELQKLANFYNK